MTGSPGFSRDVADNKPYFCVVGSPIRHSKSPVIHQAFAAQFGIGLIYERVEVRAGGLAAAIAAFREARGSGMNVTVPLKEEAWRLAAEHAPRAALAGAANTLWFGRDGTLMADNTDGVGLVRDLQSNHGIDLRDRRILLLGAGGAARGVLPALLEARPALVTVSNRTLPRAQQLAAMMPAEAPVETLPWGKDPAEPPDIIVNATALSLNEELPPLSSRVLAPYTVCYDMMYGTRATVFVAWARSHGARLALDGLGMLVEQAAEAFWIWHARRPQTGAVIAQLRSGV